MKTRYLVLNSLGSVCAIYDDWELALNHAKNSCNLQPRDSYFVAKTQYLVEVGYPKHEPIVTYLQHKNTVGDFIAG